MIQNKAVSKLSSTDDPFMDQSNEPEISFSRHLLPDKIKTATNLNKQQMVNKLRGLPTLEYPPLVYTRPAEDIPNMDFNHIIQIAAKRYDKLVNPVIKMESNFNPLAKSGAGAKGLMQ